MSTHQSLRSSFSSLQHIEPHQHHQPHEKEANDDNHQTIIHKSECCCGKSNKKENVISEKTSSCGCGCKCDRVNNNININNNNNGVVNNRNEEEKEQQQPIVNNHNHQQLIIVQDQENRPKPIPAPPMNDQCRKYCKKVLDGLLEEYELLNDSNSEESCCDKIQTNLNSKWPKYITICGIGSLLSEKSARRTFPNLINFRKAIVKNYVRCFNLVAISSLNFGDLEKRKIASVAAVHQSDLEEETIRKIIRLQSQDETRQEIEMHCSVFEIPLTEEIWCAYMTREHRYEFKFITIDQDFQNGVMQASCSCCENNCQCSELSSCGCKALMCCQFNDDSYRIERCSSYENEYHERVAQHFQGRLWYHTKHVQNEKHIHNNEIPIKPIPKYLELCFNAALEMGRSAFENFLQTSVMADGVTLLEDYLKVEEPELYQKFIGNQQDL